MAAAPAYAIPPGSIPKVSPYPRTGYGYPPKIHLNEHYETIAGGELQTGRHLDFDGEAHTRLLVSIANMMGVDINEFGYTGHGTGGLPGLTG